MRAGAAAAQTRSIGGFAVDRFEPAGAGSAWFTLESLDFRGHLQPAAGFVTEWAWKPVVIFDQAGNEVAPLVRHQVMAHVDVALVLWERTRVDISLPVAVVQSGSAGAVAGQSFTPPSGPALGDLRLSADVRVLGRAQDRLRVAAGVQLFPATGRSGAFTSDGGVRVWPRVSLAGDAGSVSFAGRLGYHFRPKDGCDCGLAPGDEITAALAVGWRVSPTVVVGPELYASSARDAFGKLTATPVELLAGAHVRAGRDFTVSGGLAPGLTDGTGSPALRVVLGVQYVPAAAGPRPVSPSPDVTLAR